MSVKLYGILIVLLIAGVIIIVSVKESGPPTPPSPHRTDTERPDPTAQAPSKDNVSTNVRETIQHLRTVVQDEPENASALLELANMLFDAHNAQEAVGYYERGLRINPGNIDARIDYSLCLFQLGRPREALDQNRSVIRLEPGNIKALYNIGAVHANQGAKDSAEYYWSKVIKIDSEDALAKQAATNIGRLHGALTQ